MSKKRDSQIKTYNKTILNEKRNCRKEIIMETKNRNKSLNVPNLRFPEFDGEWEIKEIKEILKIGSGRDYQNLKGGDIPVYGTGGYMTSVNQFLYDGESVCIGRKGTINKPFFLTGKFWTVDTLFYTYEYKDIIPKYLFYTFQKINWLKYNEASGVPSLSKSTIEKISVCIPKNDEEQEKVAKFFSLIDERIATQNKIIEKLESLINGLNEKLLSGEMADKIFKLSDICEIRSGYSGTQINGSEGLKVSRIETISQHRIDLNRVGHVNSFNSANYYKLHVGDILFSNINSVQYIGNTAYVDKEYNLYHGMNLLRLIPQHKIVEPLYIFLLLNTKKLRGYFQTICNKAVSQASINQTELGKTIVRLPSINRQCRICQIYKDVYAKKEIEVKTLELFSIQKQYLLRWMFI